jgi:hypothetical protein
MGGMVASSNWTSTAGPEIWITLPMFSAIRFAFSVRSFQLSAFSSQLFCAATLGVDFAALVFQEKLTAES